MNKYISVNKEGVKKLQRIFKIKGKEICERCVKNALAYRTNNELARKIRYAAIEQCNGCTYYIVHESECFFDSDSCMRYVCSNKAEVYFDKQTGEVTIYDRKGKVHSRYDHVSLAQINGIQEIARAL